MVLKREPANDIQVSDELDKGRLAYKMNKGCQEIIIISKLGKANLL